MFALRCLSGAFQTGVTASASSHEDPVCGSLLRHAKTDTNLLHISSPCSFGVPLIKPRQTKPSFHASCRFSCLFAKSNWRSNKWSEGVFFIFYLILLLFQYGVHESAALAKDRLNRFSEADLSCGVYWFFRHSLSLWYSRSIWTWFTQLPKMSRVSTHIPRCRPEDHSCWLSSLLIKMTGWGFEMGIDGAWGSGSWLVPTPVPPLHSRAITP